NCNGRQTLQHTVEPLAVGATAASRARRREGHRGTQSQLVDRLVEAGLAGEPQPQNHHAPLWKGRLWLYQTGLPVAAVGARERHDGEILQPKKLPARRNDAGRRAKLDRCQSRKRIRIDGFGEYEGDLVETGDAVGRVGGACRDRHGQQRQQPRLKPRPRESNGLQRLPRFGRTELQRSRSEPLPGAGNRRLNGDEPFRHVFGPATHRPEVVRKEDGDRVPAAQEFLRHDPGAVSALQAVELNRNLGVSSGGGWGEGGGGGNKKREACYRHIPRGASYAGRRTP